MLRGFFCRRRTLSSTTNISAGQMNVEIVNTVESSYSPA